MTTIWLLVDQADSTWESHLSEHEALRALSGFQESWDPQPYVRMRIVAVEVDVAAARIDWQLRRGFIEQVDGSEDAPRRAGVPLITDADEHRIEVARSLGEKRVPRRGVTLRGKDPS